MEETILTFSYGTLSIAGTESQLIDLINAIRYDELALPGNEDIKGIANEIADALIGGC